MPRYTIEISIFNKHIGIKSGFVGTDGGSPDYGLMNVTPDELLAIALAYKDGNWYNVATACEAARKW